MTRMEMGYTVGCWRDEEKEEGQVVIVWARPPRY